MFRFLANLVSSSPKPARRPARPKLEALEDRLALSTASVTSDGVLRIVGDDDRADTAVVNTENILLNNVNRTLVHVDLNGQRFSFFLGSGPGEVHYVPNVDGSGFGAYMKFVGRSGNDSFTNNTNLQSIAEGGKGYDVLVGGSNRDLLLGQENDDQLFGRGGMDYLYGGSENDTLDGGRDGYADRLQGDSGTDVFVQHGYYYGTKGGSSIEGEYAVDCNWWENDTIKTEWHAW